MLGIIQNALSFILFYLEGAMYFFLVPCRSFVFFVLSVDSSSAVFYAKRVRNTFCFLRDRIFFFLAFRLFFLSFPFSLLDFILMLHYDLILR